MAHSAVGKHPEVHTLSLQHQLNRHKPFILCSGLDISATITAFFFLGLSELLKQR